MELEAAAAAAAAAGMVGPPPGSPGGSKRATAVVECPRSMVGRVIGKNGNTIKALQQYSGALIQIDQTVDPTKVTISGTPNSLNLAVSMVTDIVKGTFKGFALLRQLSASPYRLPTPLGTPRPVYAPGYGLIPPSQLYGMDDRSGGPAAAYNNPFMRPGGMPQPGGPPGGYNPYMMGQGQALPQQLLMGMAMRPGGGLMPGGPGGGGFMPGDLSGVLPGGLAYGGYGGPDDYAPGAAADAAMMAAGFSRGGGGLGVGGGDAGGIGAGARLMQAAAGAGRGVYGLRDDGGGAGEQPLGGVPSQLGAGALAGAAGLLPMMDPQGRVFYYEPQANAF